MQKFIRTTFSLDIQSKEMLKELASKGYSLSGAVKEGIKMLYAKVVKSNE